MSKEVKILKRLIKELDRKIIDLEIQKAFAKKLLKDIEVK